MRNALVLGFLAVAVVSSQAEAQELRIGHLEATDDSGGINWAFFHCEQNGQALECDVFQTLIQHELSADQRAAYINKHMHDKPLKDFADKDFCAGMAVVANAARTGKGGDGRPLSQEQIQSILPVFDAADQACRNPNLNTAHRFFEAMADQKMRTCNVFNDYSHSQFMWNAPTQNWVFKSGPSGPCGTVTIGTLERDKTVNSSVSTMAGAAGLAGYWLYTERHIFTNRSGVLPNGLSCNKFPDVTLHYTWRAAPNFVGCSIVQNDMN